MSNKRKHPRPETPDKQLKRQAHAMLSGIFEEFPYIAEDLSLKRAKRAKNKRIRRRLREIRHLLVAGNQTYE